MERFFFCCNLTGTQVNNFDPVQYPLIPIVTTITLDVLLTENLSNKSFRKYVFFVILVKLLANGTV